MLFCKFSYNCFEFYKPHFYFSHLFFNDFETFELAVNDKFIEVSKYSKEELIGKGHNTTRHPDMPKEVFKEKTLLNRANTILTDFWNIDSGLILTQEEQDFIDSLSSTIK